MACPRPSTLNKPNVGRPQGIAPTILNKMIRHLQKIAFAFLVCFFASVFCHAQKADGFFRVEQRSGVWWFITPDGEPFFSNGVNVITEGQIRKNYNPKKPEYAAFRFYPTTDAWMNETLKRLKDWNFNTVGGWSSRELERGGAMPYTKVLHLGGSKFAPWGDMFGAEVAARIDAEAKREIGNLKTDKNLIGYFSDNELGWWDDTVFWYFLNQPAANKTRRVLMKLLREHYSNKFAELRKDFDTGRARDFAALELDADLTLKPEGRGADVIDKFIFIVAERYYKLAFESIRRYDPNHLILGDRYPSWYSQSVARASIPYVDVVSTNYMADWTDGNISKFYLDSLHRITNKPIIITEYYMSATENRSGNKNSSAGFPVVQTQKQRAASFRRNLNSFAELPYVIGAHWFQFMDEPPFGRSDGEDYNMGLVDINDRPYEELIAAAKSLNVAEIHAQSKTANKNSGEILKVSKNTDANWLDWNERFSFVAPLPIVENEYPFADCYAAWNADELYLVVYAIDFIEPRIYARSVIPESERMTLTINSGDNQKPLRIRFGADGEPNVEAAKLEYKFQNSSTRSTLLIRIPASFIGRKNLKSSDKIQLQATLKSHSRFEQMRWNQTLVLSEREAEKM